MSELRSPEISQTLLRGENRTFKGRAIFGDKFVGHAYVTNYRLIFIQDAQKPSDAKKVKENSHQKLSKSSKSYPLTHVVSVNNYKIREFESKKGIPLTNLKTTINENNLAWPGTDAMIFEITTCHQVNIYITLVHDSENSEVDQTKRSIQFKDAIEKWPNETFAKSYYSDRVKNENKFDLTKEYTRLVNNAAGIWKITETNQHFNLSSSLPEKFIIPVEAENEAFLEKIAKFRRGGMFPVLSWIHPKTQVALCRSSEPKISDPPQQNEDDVKYLDMILEANPQADKLCVFDARLENHAIQAKYSGGGYEKKGQGYENVEVKFLNIQTSNELTNSMKEIQQVFRNNIVDTKEFHKRVHESQWIHHVRMCLNGVCQIIDQLETFSNTCLVHCSDGREKTPIITALSMLMLDGNYRTIFGFQALIEMEFLIYSYNFSGYLMKHKSLPPGFVLFLDCCYQLIKQFPSAFEFDERILLSIYYHWNSNKFGTFLYESHKERREKFVDKETISLWTSINQEPNLVSFRNAGYHRSKYHQQVIYPTVNINSMHVFKSMHSNFTTDKNKLDDKFSVTKNNFVKIKLLEKQVHDLRRMRDSMKE